MSNDRQGKTTIMDADDELKSILQTFVQETTLVTADDAIQGKRATLPGIKGQRYEVGEILGAGGMGVVLEAFDRNLQRSVAMKVLQRARVTDGSHALRFIREAEITGGLEHPNIIPLHEIGLDKGSNAYYTMKQVKGETLKHILKQLKENNPDYVAKYPFQRLIEIFLKVCNAIDLAHDRGVIHRDLKPDNIMVGDYGEVLVIDWGLARRTNDAEDELAIETDDEAPLEFVTQAGAVMGTPGFMSPEQARGHEVGPLSDVFSLGAILFNVLTFRPPVVGKNLREVLINLLKGEISTPEEIWRDRSDGIKPVHLPGGQVPLGLSAVAMKALAIRPDNRYLSVSDLRKDVESFQSGFATGAEQASLLRQLVLMVKRYKKSIALISTVAIAIVLYGGFFTLKLKQDIDVAEAQEQEANELSTTAEAKRNDALEVYEALRSKAPTLEWQARYKLDRHETDNALKLVSQAIFLDGDNGDYYQLKGDILQNRFQFSEAAHAYDKAIKLNGPQPGLPSCLETSLKFAEMPNEEFLELLNDFSGYLRESGRFQESLNTSQQLSRRLDPYEKTGAELVKTKSWDATLSVKDDILYGNDGIGMGKQKAICLDIKKCDPYFDFHDIQGMRVKDLRIYGATFLTGWEALVGQHSMHRLVIKGTESFDFSNLRGMKIRSLQVECDRPKNVTVVNDMGLLELGIGSQGLTDSSTSGLTCPEVTTVWIWDASITNVDFLERFPVLRYIQITKTPVADISVFERLPKLTLTGVDLDQTDIDNLLPLKKHSVVFLSCNDSPITSLDGVNMEELVRLSVRSTMVNNLEYLNSVKCPKLKKVDLSGCPLRDLNPLSNVPTLSSLDVKGTFVTDLPSSIIATLTELNVDEGKLSGDSITELRAAKKLKKINGVPAGKFWQDYDKSRKQRAANER